MDPNADLVRQLTRVADALTKPGPSPWTEWAKTLASFITGVALTYFGIAVQGRASDKREQAKMRRIIYKELTNSFLYLYGMVSNLRSMPPRRPNLTGEIHPPTVRLINPPFTFEGDEYMRQNHSVSYQLPEMATLKRMYVQLSRLQPGNSATIGELEIPLVHLGEAFKNDAIVKNNFRRFGGQDSQALEAVANYFADHEIRIEDMVIISKTGASQ